MDEETERRPMATACGSDMGFGFEKRVDDIGGLGVQLRFPERYQSKMERGGIGTGHCVDIAPCVEKSPDCNRLPFLHAV